MTKTLAAHISSAFSAIQYNKERGIEDDPNVEALEALVKLLPSGSGFDDGTTFDEDASTSNKLVFTGGYHHMHPGGFYAGWSCHTVVVTPTFDGLNVAVEITDDEDVREYSETHVEDCAYYLDHDESCDCDAGFYDPDDQQNYVAETFLEALRTRYSVSYNSEKREFVYTLVK